MRNPILSIIIPAYNCERYIEETVKSALTQNLSDKGLEVIVVNDGSTDGTLEILDRMARDSKVLKVLNQKNSGGPSQPRNEALNIARGKYVFFLDADDIMAADAAKEIIEVAEANSSDVLLAKFGSINGRHVPLQMFRHTKGNADLIDDLAWDSLGPVKLFRRELIEKLRLRFAEDQWIGEDQPFTAAMYLNAKVVSILANRELIMIRKRDDGGNITSRSQSLNDKFKTAHRLGKVVYSNTVPGARRDRLMRRIFTATLSNVIGKIFLSATEEEQRRFVTDAREFLRPFYSEGVEKYCNHASRMQFFVLFHESFDRILAFARTSNEFISKSYVRQNDGKFYAFAVHEELSLLPASVRMYPGQPRLKVKLLDLKYQVASVQISGEIKSVDIVAPVEITGVYLVERATGRRLNLPILESQNDGSSGVRFKTELVDSDLHSSEHLVAGAWGIFLEVKMAGYSQEVRFGKRENHVPNVRYNWQSRSGALITSYFNHGYQNLTFDVGSTVHRDNPAIVALFSRIDQRLDGSEASLVLTLQANAHFNVEQLDLSKWQDPSIRALSDRIVEVYFPLSDSKITVIEPAIKYGRAEYYLNLNQLVGQGSQRFHRSIDSHGRLKVRPQWTSTPLLAKDRRIANESIERRYLDMYWWDKRANFGDAIGPWIGETLTGLQVRNVYGQSGKNGIVSVGSLINNLNVPGHTVWGTGLIAPISPADSKRLNGSNPRSILAVRGELTKKELEKSMGWDVPNVLGDPALVLPEIYQPKSTIEDEDYIAFVPHYAHVSAAKVRLKDGYEVVDVRMTPDKVVDQIAGAKACISSSLHGIIIAQAYGVPWVWLNVSDRPLVGGEFKFEDFFSTLERSKVVEYKIATNELPNLELGAVAKMASLPRTIVDIRRIIDSFPEPSNYLRV